MLIDVVHRFLVRVLMAPWKTLRTSDRVSTLHPPPPARDRTARVDSHTTYIPQPRRVGPSVSRPNAFPPSHKASRTMSQTPVAAPSLKTHCATSTARSITA